MWLNIASLPCGLMLFPLLPSALLACRSDLPVSLILVGAQVLLPRLETTPGSAGHSGGSGGGSGSGSEDRGRREAEAEVEDFARLVAGWTLSHVHATRYCSCLKAQTVM